MSRHEAIVDWEILNPGRNHSECAHEMGVSETHLSVIYNSDAFIAYRHDRLASHHQNVSNAVVDKTENLAKLSLDILAERFANERKEVPLGGVKDTCEMALKALGFGSAPKGANGAVSLNVMVGATPEQLAAAREKIGVADALSAPTPAVAIDGQKTPEEETTPETDLLPTT